MVTCVPNIPIKTLSVLLTLSFVTLVRAQTPQPEATTALPAASEPPAAAPVVPPSATTPTPTESDALTPPSAAVPSAPEAAPTVDVTRIPAPQPPPPVFGAAELPPPPAAPPTSPHWYELLKIRGYTQLRYSNIPSGDSNENLINDQGDKYIGRGAGFAIRRARVILYGEVHERVSVYLQTDFASAIGDQNHVAIVRDWYADVFLDPRKEFRLRLGQSKVPFGFENMQSSQNRLALDRNDGLNSAVKDERDLGIFAYWAPEGKRKLFKELVDNNFKGSGDYGVVALGVYNGQTANRFDYNDNFHVIGRLVWPFEIGNQVLEIGGGGYTGLYTIKLEDQGDVEFTTNDQDLNLRDARAYGQIVLYPRPLGIQIEFNAGVGPEIVEGQPGRVETKPLQGGYAQVFYKIDEPFGTISMIPYVRAQYYQGGKKFETNTPRYEVKEIEVGVEWQIPKALECTLVYTFVDRTSSKYPYTQQQGQLFRAQVQFNY